MVIARNLEVMTQAATIVLLPKKDLKHLVELLTEEFLVFGPVQKRNEHVFERIENADQLSLDYHTTVLPPKKILHRPFETLFSFHEDEGVIDVKQPEEKQILFGVHPCDVHAISILDEAYSHEYEDPYYLSKRKNTLIFALNCSNPGEDCFCSSLGTGPDLKEGFDLAFTDLGDQYLIEVGSEEGQKILDMARLTAAPRVTLVQKEKKLSDGRKKFKKRLLVNDLHDLLAENFRHPIWEELMEKCLACGSCTMVCPTCFCYNVVDKMDLSLKSGERQREWDSCMLLEYAQVALGHNFRKDRDARIKQRIYHKLLYYEPQFGTLGCVGCGRCLHTCVKQIDITEIVNRIRGE
jgi:ferredoxin